MNYQELGPWILSAVAILQVWIIGLWRRIKRPVVEIYESRNIEVGFSSFGPTIALYGTLRVKNRDTFVKNIRIKVVKRKNCSTYSFNWRAFRPHSIPLTTADPVKLEIASSFLLTPADPYKYGIVFIDDTFVAEVNPKVAHITGEYFQFRRQRLQEIKEQHQLDIASMLNNPLVEETLYDEFSQKGLLTSAYSAVDRSFYWEAGKYDLTIIVECVNPTKDFKKSFLFALSEDDERILRLNVIAILRTLCGFTERWNFAYPEYRSISL